MTKLKNIRTKILIGYSVIVLFIVALAIINYFSTKSVNQQMDKVMDKHTETLVASEQFSASISGQIAALRGYVLFGNSTDRLRH